MENDKEFVDELSDKYDSIVGERGSDSLEDKSNMIRSRFNDNVVLVRGTVM